MTVRSTRFALPTVALALALLLESHDARAEYRYLCTSIPEACTYRGPDVPSLKANVCYDPTLGSRLMSGGSCPAGAWPYFVDAGEVIDPLTNEVAAYVPLDDACSRPGICVEGPPPAGAQEYPMCCKTNSQGVETCYDGAGCGGSLWWCHDGVCNDDGTITCFKKDPF